MEISEEELQAMINKAVEIGAEKGALKALQAYYGNIPITSMLPPPIKPYVYPRPVSLMSSSEYLQAEKDRVVFLNAQIKASGDKTIKRVRRPKYDRILIEKMKQQILLDHNEKVRKKRDTENRNK